MSNYKKDAQLISERYSKIYTEDHGPDFPFETLSDGELIRLANQYGIEEELVQDGEGGVANRDEVIARLREVEAADIADINGLNHAMEDEETSFEQEEGFDPESTSLEGLQKRYNRAHRILSFGKVKRANTYAARMPDGRFFFVVAVTTPGSQGTTYVFAEDENGNTVTGDMQSVLQDLVYDYHLDKTVPEITSNTSTAEGESMEPEYVGENEPPAPATSRYIQ